jgi:hypothetical protein
VKLTDDESWWGYSHHGVAMGGWLLTLTAHYNPPVPVPPDDWERWFYLGHSGGSPVAFMRRVGAMSYAALRGGWLLHLRVRDGEYVIDSQEWVPAKEDS